MPSCLRNDRTRATRWLLFAATALVLLASGCAQLAHKERELVFRIEPGEARWFSGLPQGVRELEIPVQAGTSESHLLHALWWPAADPAAPTLLYLHGARWNLTGQMFRIEQLHEFGFSVLAIDYRGFGKSSGGLPSEETVYEDALAAWQRLARLQPDPGRRYIYGHSLGGAVAIDLAARLSSQPLQTPAGPQLPARGLIIESTFTTLADMARSLSYGWLPVELILSQKFDSAGKMARIRMPVLLVHGSDDRYVPPRFSQALYEATHAPKKLLIVQGGTHNNSMRVGAGPYRAALRELFGLERQTQALQAD